MYRQFVTIRLFFLLLLGLVLAGCISAAADEIAVSPTEPSPPTEPGTPAEPSTPTEPRTPTAEAPESLTPQQVTANFYDWYLGYIGDPASETFRNPLVDQAYRDTPYLSASFVGHVDELLAGFAGGGYDPFLCAQNVPTEMTPDVVFTRSDRASVVVRSSFPNHMVTVDLQPEGERWVISNITCAQDPAGIATTFYTWYLGYIGDRSRTELHNPLVTRAYQGHPLLSETFVQEVDQLLASFDQGGYDPFLLAQDIPTDFSVDPGVVEGTAIVHLQFSPNSVRHLLVTVDERRKISAIGENDQQPSSAPETEAEGTPLQSANTSDAYGFSFDYPAGWVLQPEAVAGPGLPEDWPVQALWYLMPPDVADALARQSGPPDPNATVIVSPFQIEVVEGDAQAVERVYAGFASGEQVTMNGHEAIILYQEPGYSHVIFPHPLRPNTWVIFTDWVTTFPGREAQGTTAVPTWQLLLNSLYFHQ